MIRILFLCTGNICRSPMADGIMRHLVRQAGLEQHIEVDSAGVDSYEAGSPTHQGTVNALKKHGITFSKRARLLENDDAHFDYLIGMTSQHTHTLTRLKMTHGSDQTVVARLMDYAPQFTERDVPDPYYNGEFDRVYDLILAGVQGLLATIRATHNL